MAILPRVFQGSIATMDASSSPIYSAGAWTFKNSSGVTTLSVSDTGLTTIGPDDTSTVNIMRGGTFDFRKGCYLRLRNGDNSNWSTIRCPDANTTAGFEFIAGAGTAASCTHAGAWTLGSPSNNLRHYLPNVSHRTLAFSMTGVYVATSQLNVTTEQYISNDQAQFGSYLVSICWNDLPGGATEYRNTITGIVNIFCGWNGSAVTKYMSWTLLSQAIRPGSGLTVTVETYWDTAAGVTGIPLANNERWKLVLSGVGICNSQTPNYMNASAIRMN